MPAFWRLFVHLSAALPGLLPAAAGAAEGMWTLDNLPRAALRQQYGFEPDARWIEHVMKASVRLAGGCSGSFVSPEGLVLTNAHCAIGCVQELSDARNDYVNQGFVARSREQERRCPAMELNRLEAITDVTATIDQATQGRTGPAYSEAKKAAKARLQSACVGQDAEHRRCDVVELYQGGQYHLYRYHRFQDVRLVFSPEYAVGFFGGDPDNFQFPRYNLDMALLRAYENGEPAAMADYFPVKAQGAQPGELTMVTGHPGSTQRHYTVAQLETLRDVELIGSLLYYAERRGMLAQYARQGSEQARQSQTDLTFTENSYKVYLGRLRALQDPALMALKRKQEEELRASVAADAWTAAAWQDIAAANRLYRDIETPYKLIEKDRAFYSKYFTLARQLVRAAEERPRPNEQRLPEFQDAALPALTQQLFSSAPIYPDYERAKLSWSLTKLRELMGPDDGLVKLVLGRDSPEALAARLVGGTLLSDVELRRRLWEGGAEAIMNSEDPFIRLARAVDAPARALRRQYEDEVAAVEEKGAERIARARFARYGTAVYPDATFTLRLSFGEVRGWEEAGRSIAPFTDLAGLFRRHSGADPFALPARWLDRRERLALSTPLNFVTTNDITGGNSGSPLINRDAQIVGLAFDGNIHSLGGAYWFDERVNRCVAVHPAAILEALRGVYDAEGLVRELEPRS